jgi:uncharacterized membrane protein YsdA (DUF1294 family)
MDNSSLLILVVLAAINLIAFLLMLLDKLKSTNPNAERISEGQLFFLATVFGSLGVFIGMFVFRHKTRKWYFLIGIPLLFVENLAAAFLIYLFLFNK